MNLMLGLQVQLLVPVLLSDSALTSNHTWATYDVEAVGANITKTQLPPCRHKAAA